VYNNWIVERLGGIDRIKLAAMIPTWDVDMAIDEVRRMASNPSVGGLLLPLVGTPEWNLPVWEPLWAAIQETAIPAVMHQGSGHDMIFYRGWGSPTANLLTTQSMAPRAAALLSCSGVLERHPDLHVVMVEVNAGWMAWTMSTLDEYYTAHQRNGWTKPILAELPSHYLRHQVHATFQDDPVALHNIPLTGTDCLLWGNDYPHPESTYPDSNRVLDRLLGDVAPDDARAVVFDNAARVFGFSQHARKCARHGPEPARRRGRAFDPEGEAARRAAHVVVDRRGTRSRRRAQQPRVHRAGAGRPHTALAPRVLPIVREQGRAHRGGVGGVARARRGEAA
jgi:predicted TIM-barrel fold metal-dependent hydrolase